MPPLRSVNLPLRESSSNWLVGELSGRGSLLSCKARENYLHPSRNAARCQPALEVSCDSPRSARHAACSAMGCEELMLCLVVRTAVPMLGHTAPRLAAAQPSMAGSSEKVLCVGFSSLRLFSWCPSGCPSPSSEAKGGTGCCLRMSQFRCESL